MNPVVAVQMTRPATSSRRNLIVSALVLICLPLAGAAIAWGILPSASVYSSVFGIAATLFVLWGTGGNYNLLHPARVLGCVWCGCLALASLRLTTEISEWNGLMWVYVSLALLSFLGGVWLTTRRAAWVRNPQAQSDKRTLPPSEFVAPRRTLLVAFFCLLVGSGALAYEYWQIGVVPILSQNVDVARTTFFATAGQWRDPRFDTVLNKIVGLLVLFLKYGVFLAYILLFQNSSKTRSHTLFAVAMIAYGSLALSSQGSRGFIFELLVAGVALYHYLRRRVSGKQVALCCLLLFSFLAASAYYRLAYRGSALAYNRASRLSNLPAGTYWDGFVFGYSTVTGPFEVFYRLTQDLPGQGPSDSGYLFYAFHRFLPRQSIQELSVKLYTGEMMTPTFLGEFYADYGWLGVILGPLVLGLGYGWTYSRANRCKSLYWICVQGVLLSLLIYFAWLNFFSQQFVWLWDLFNLAWLIRLVKRGNRRSAAMARNPSEVRLGVPPSSIQLASR